MSVPAALLTFSIGPVHSFIDQARRVADLWAGSDLLSHLIGRAVHKVQEWEGAEMIFPSVTDKDPVPPGLPNRFVCRVPQAQADDLAHALKAEVEAEWNRRVAATAEQLGRHGLGPAAGIWTADGSAGPRQTDHLLEIAWSWVPENGSYAQAAREGARRFAASRLFRPFPQIEERDEKCAVCGERTALPDGDRPRVRESWKDAAEHSEKTPDEPYLRQGQGRLCLVCATKRFYPTQCGKRTWFASFRDFEPSEKKPYLALVALDGDRMGDILGWPESRLASNEAERFHRELSQALAKFAENLRRPDKADLNLEFLGRSAIPGHKNAQLTLQLH